MFPTNQKVVGSNPAGLIAETLANQAFARVFLFHVILRLAVFETL